jgi:hypothetical protein
MIKLLVRPTHPTSFSKSKSLARSTSMDDCVLSPSKVESPPRMTCRSCRSMSPHKGDIPPCPPTRTVDTETSPKRSHDIFASPVTSARPPRMPRRSRGFLTLGDVSPSAPQRTIDKESQHDKVTPTIQEPWQPPLLNDSSAALARAMLQEF